jgi:hypothetical protein
MAPKETTKIVIHYGGARAPFHAEVPSDETIGTVKAKVMETFRLFEGATTFYDLYLDHRVLADLEEPVGRVAGGRTKLELQLMKQYHG